MFTSELLILIIFASALVAHFALRLSTPPASSGEVVLKSDARGWTGAAMTDRAGTATFGVVPPSHRAKSFDRRINLLLLAGGATLVGAVCSTVAMIPGATTRVAGYLAIASTGLALIALLIALKMLAGSSWTAALCLLDTLTCGVLLGATMHTPAVYRSPV